MAVTPLALFPCPPCHPPQGGIPARHPIRRKQGPRQGIPLLQPCHGPCILPSALRQGRRRPFPLPQGPAPPLLILARYFLSRPQVSSFPARCLPLHRFTDLFGRRRRCSRRGRAAASLPSGFVHRLPLRSPRPSLASAIVRRGRAALRPSGRLASAPVRPGGAPSLGRGGGGGARGGGRPGPGGGCLFFF